MIFRGLWFKVSDVDSVRQANQNQNPCQIWGIFVICMMLSSCSSGQNAFFAQSNALLSQGYTWQKLDRCRPVKGDALSIPVIRSDGRKLVCFKLVPPQNGTAASVAATILAINSATQTPATSPPAAIAPARKIDESSVASGIIWNFSNF